MQPDADLQVWLMVQAESSCNRIAPMVQSPADKQIAYRITVAQDSGAGTSRIAQSGTAELKAARPSGLSSLALKPAQDCRIEIELREQDRNLGTYRFACPR